MRIDHGIYLHNESHVFYGVLFSFFFYLDRRRELGTWYWPTPINQPTVPETGVFSNTRQPPTRVFVGEEDATRFGVYPSSDLSIQFQLVPFALWYTPSRWLVIMAGPVHENPFCRAFVQLTCAQTPLIMLAGTSKQYTYVRLIELLFVPTLVRVFYNELQYIK